MIPKNAQVLCADHTGKYKRVTALPRVYRKEVIYGGTYVSGQGKGVKFAVGEDEVRHWAETGNLMLSRGLKIPMPVGHVKDDPEKTRAYAESFEVGVHEEDDEFKGQPALYTYVRFVDDDAERNLVKKPGVSIYSPPEYVDGRNHKYERPPLHIAFTDYPVIPGLGPFQELAASLMHGSSEGQMADQNPPADGAPAQASAPTDVAGLGEAFKKLGMIVPDGLDDTQLIHVIFQWVTGLKAQADAAGAAPPPKPKPAAPAAPAVAASNAPAFKPTKGMMSLARDGRTAKIDALVTGMKISPAVAKRLKDQHCSDEALELALSNDAGDPGFDSMIDALKENEVVKLREERTGGQTLQLANSSLGDAAKNPLLADAEARAKAGPGRRASW